MSLFRAHLYKLLRDPLFYIGIFGTALLCACRNIPPNFTATRDTVSELGAVLDISSMRKMIAVFGALPFAANFADEWTNHVTIGCVSRCGIKRYAASNVVMCFISSLATVFLGMMLFAGVLSCVKPVFKDSGNPMDILMETLLRDGMPWEYIMYRVFVFAASCAMWSVMGMMITSFFPNKYVGLCSPFVASYIVERFSMQLPSNFNLWYVSVSYLYWKNIWGQFFYSLGLFLSLAVVCGLVFALTVKRRVQNEAA